MTRSTRSIALISSIITTITGAACGDDAGTGTPAPDQIDADVAELIDAAADAVDEPEADSADAPVDISDTSEPDVTPPCQLALTTEGTGIHRGDLAPDFTLDLVDGGVLALSATYNGCESFVFLSDRIVVSPLDERSIWESESDLEDLLFESPDDVHYVFVSAFSGDSAAANVSAMQARIDGLVDALPESPRTHWRAHLHVVATRAADLDSWVGDVMTISAAKTGHLAMGFAIDHQQRIRGVGSFADALRRDQALADAGEWPWKQNLAYAAHEAHYMRAEAARHAALAAEDALVIDVFGGEVLSRFEDADVTLPDADALGAYDTVEVEITQRCPDPDLLEFGNCGAWDYLAHLWLVEPVEGGAGDEAPTRHELARFITTYHREAHWVADVTPLLALAPGGGARRFRWQWAPEFNPQPTATWLSLRFSNRNIGLRPVSTQLLFTGGDFNSAYNDREPVTVAIPATTKKAELRTLVTGHGSGENKCAEFCEHGHNLAVNGSTYTKVFTEARDTEGCVPMIHRGMTPNQGGTWWTGRGGWCPGAPVEPWIVDVTGDVTPGDDATFTYEGLFAGKAPPDGSGNIVLTVNLVLYE